MAGCDPLKRPFLTLFWPLMALGVILPAAGEDLSTWEEVGITAAELALLDQPKDRSELPCRISLARAVLGFDYRFHAGFRATIPLKKLKDTDELVMFYRVRALNSRAQPLYYRNAIAIGSQLQGGSTFLLEGVFVLGEGEYVVDVAFQSGAGKACSRRFEMETRRSKTGVPLTIEPGAVAWRGSEPGSIRPREDAGRPLKLEFMVNVPPFPNSSRALMARDVSYLLHILKYIVERSPIDAVRMTAFNLKEQRVLYRQPFRRGLALVDFGSSLGGVESTQVSVRSLHEDAVRNFLTDLVQREVRQSEADAVIFLGPHGFRGDRLKKVGRALQGKAPPLFYLRFRYRPRSPAFGDPIKDVVTESGGKAYDLVDPYELWKAWDDILEALQAG